MAAMFPNIAKSAKSLHPNAYIMYSADGAGPRDEMVYNLKLGPVSGALRLGDHKLLFGKRFQKQGWYDVDNTALQCNRMTRNKKEKKKSERNKDKGDKKVKKKGEKRKKGEKKNKQTDKKKERRQRSRLQEDEQEMEDEEEEDAIETVR